MNAPYTLGSLYSGIGGIELGFEATGGFRTVWQVENDPFCARVLRKHWPRVKRHGDIKRVKPERLARVDVIVAGMPCQPVSTAGQQQGDADPRWLWPDTLRIVCALRPRVFVLENVPGLLSAHSGRLFGEILGDLAASGYDAEWGCVAAANVGAPHLRWRVFLIAYPRESRRPIPLEYAVPHADHAGRLQYWGPEPIPAQHHSLECACEALAHPDAGPREAQRGQRPDAQSPSGIGGPWPRGRGGDAERQEPLCGAGQSAEVANAHREPQREPGHRASEEHLGGPPWLDAGRGGELEALADPDPPGRDGQAQRLGREPPLAGSRAGAPLLADAAGLGEQPRTSSSSSDAPHNELAGAAQGRDAHDGRAGVPHPDGFGWEARQPDLPGRQPDAAGRRGGQTQRGLGRGLDGIQAWLDGSWEQGIPRVVAHQANRAPRLKSIGNAVSPQVAQVIAERVHMILEAQAIAPTAKRSTAGAWSMRFAYADPPYPGQALKHYRHDPKCAEVDHAALIARLCSEFPDGWALSTSTPALRDVLALTPPGTRVMAWVKPFASFKPGVNPAYAWEPVLVFGGRKRGRDLPTIRDWCSANITMRKGLAGAKPPAFCHWLFQVLGAKHGDELVDLFPGTGAVGRAWNEFQQQASPPEIKTKLGDTA